MFMVEDSLIVRPVSPILGVSVLNQLSVPLNDIEVQVVNVGQARGISSFGCFFCYRLCSNQCFPEVAKARTMRIRIHGLVYLNFYWLI
ncbi:unnamed protein product [Prunus brigantina]